MKYPLQRRVKPRSYLCPEEVEVMETLSPYSDDPRKAKPTDFVPLETLYRLYLDRVMGYTDSAGDLEVLSLSKFGAAVRRVFPYLEDQKRVLRTINGKQIGGFIGLKGPGSIAVPAGPGRPYGKGTPTALARFKARLDSYRGWTPVSREAIIANAKALAADSP